MAQTVGQHGVAAFTNPSNGDPLDATVVKANDNSVRGAYVDHDSDGGIHLQSSALASRPVAGTAGRKWLTTDTGSVKLWFDTGAAWEEISYVPTTGSPSFTNATLNGTTTNAGTISGGTISGGTVSGGTVAPTTLTVPTGTTIPTHTETGTITATGSTRNGGTLSGATLNNTTFTGTITGISTNPTVYYAARTSTINVAYGTLTTVLTLSSVPAGTYLISALTNGRSYGSSGTVGLNAQIKVGGVEVASTVSYADATTQYTPCFQTTAVATLSSAANITLEVVASGSGTTPVVYGGSSTQTFISATRIN